MKNIKYSLAPIVSLLLIVAYYLPWITFYFGDWNIINSRKALGFNIFGVISFAFAWIPLIIFSFLAIRNIKKENIKYKAYINISVSIIFFYLVVFIGIVNGYVLTI